MKEMKEMREVKEMKEVINRFLSLHSISIDFNPFALMARTNKM